MYRLADKLLEQLKKLIRREFNRLGIIGFDELNASRVSLETTELFGRLMRENERLYLQVSPGSNSSGIFARYFIISTVGAFPSVSKIPRFTSSEAQS